MTDETKQAIEIVEGMIVKSRFDGKDMTADSLAHLIQLVKDYEEMLGDATRIEIGPTQVLAANDDQKWYASTDVTFHGPHESALEAWKSLKEKA